MPHLIEYDLRLAPEGGAEVLGELCAPIECTSKEPAGAAFHRKAQIQAGFLDWDHDGQPDEDEADDGSGSDSESTASEEEEARPAGIPRPKAPKGKDGKKKETREDLYKWLGLETERWMASEKQIRDAYRKAALNMHPDKAVSLGLSKEEAEDQFKKLQEAYEVLSDPAKRKEFDSVDEFDDYLPSTCDSGDFFKVFGPAFRRQSKWSDHKPVPPVGDEGTPWHEVQKFYDFWYHFKSWRVFPHPDEEDEEQAGSRDERRWIQKHNQKLRAKAKKDETRRLRDFVDAAWNCDPRVAAAHQEKKQAREDRKRAKAEARRKEAEEARRRAAEADAARLAAEQEQRAREEEERQRAKEERRQLREHRANVGRVCRERGLADSADIALLCEHLSLAEFETLGQTLGKEGASKEEQSAAVRALIKAVRERLRAEEDDKAARAAEVQERLASEKAEAHRRKMEVMGEWSEEELRLLEKGLKKYPVGTKQRWEQVAAYVRTRTPDEVITMVKDHLAKGKIPANMVKDGIVIKDKYKSNLDIKSEASTRSSTFSDVAVPAVLDAARREDLATPKPPAKVVSSVSGEWTAVQQESLIKAMKTFGKDVPDRWEKIAMAVPGKTRQECFSRFKELKEEHQAKKQAPAKAAEGEAGAGAGTGAAAGAAAGASGGPWTAEEEQSLVQALKVVGKDAPDRFVRVAERIPGRTKEECQAKFKAMKAAYQAKKQDS